ncbi:MAG: hypothetical protein V4642_06675 [Bacteroidota bacterium]
MKFTKLFVILFTTIILAGCVTSPNFKLVRQIYTPIPQTSKNIDIPLYKKPHPLEGLPYNYWHYSKQKQEQLKLISPETSAAAQIFRVWITNPVGRSSQPHGIIEIVQDSNKMEGNLILMNVDFDVRKLKETIADSKRIALTPKTLSWSQITDSLIALQFHELPTDEKLPGYDLKTRGYSTNATTFSFEYATPEKYRFYQYTDIYQNQHIFTEVANVVKMLDLLESEFEWDTQAREYFR